MTSSCPPCDDASRPEGGRCPARCRTSSRPWCRSPALSPRTGSCYRRCVARVVFTANLQRHVPCPPTAVEADTVGAALDQVFDANPRLRGYVVDERGALRKHMTIFVDGELVKDRLQLSDPVRPHTEIYVMQALSGG